MIGYRHSKVVLTAIGETVAVLRRSYEWDANQPTPFVDSTNGVVWGFGGF